MSDQLLGLKALVEQANLIFTAYEIGRFVKPISNADWEKFEYGEYTWPFPVQQHAHFAIVGLGKDQQESIVWPLKLPLDERGRLNLGARDQLVHTLISRASDNAKALAEGRSEDLKSAAEDIAQAVQMPLLKQAKLNALARRTVKADTADGYHDVLHWLKSESAPWQALSLQAIADLCVRQDEQGITTALANKIASCELDVLKTMTELLEGEHLQPALTNQLLALLKNALTSDKSPEYSACFLRALSGTEKAHEAVALVVNSAHGASIDCISVIAGRAWLTLQQPDITLRFFENLAQLDRGQSFASVTIQLLYIEAIRPFILGAFQQTNLQSQELKSAISTLLQR